MRGTAAGLFQTARETGGAIGVALLGAVYVMAEGGAIARGLAS